MVPATALTGGGGRLDHVVMVRASKSAALQAVAAAGWLALAAVMALAALFGVLISVGAAYLAYLGDIDTPPSSEWGGVVSFALLGIAFGWGGSVAVLRCWRERRRLRALRHFTHAAATP